MMKILPWNCFFYCMVVFIINIKCNEKIFIGIRTGELGVWKLISRQFADKKVGIRYEFSRV